MSVLQKLTEGLVNRDLQKQGAALMDKWEATGLLEGLGNDQSKTNMARLLENQAAELLREASSMAAGDVEGFASVAFPIVRRVFGGLIANELVSVQPMSLPSGLIFFLDFTHTNSRLGADAGESVYGGGRVGKDIISGSTADGLTENGSGFYNLANAYAGATGSFAATFVATDGPVDGNAFAAFTTTTIGALTEAQKRLIKHDPDILAMPAARGIIQLQMNDDTVMGRLNKDQLGAISISNLANDDTLVRRLTYIDDDGNLVFTIIDGATSAVTIGAGSNPSNPTVVYPFRDNFTEGGGLGSVVGANRWPLEEPTPQTGNAGVPHDGAGGSPGKHDIAEIDIKVDSTAVTAITKKLKAKWSPELGQDLNAYHNLDAEVELTSVLSEHRSIVKFLTTSFRVLKLVHTTGRVHLVSSSRKTQAPSLVLLRLLQISLVQLVSGMRRLLRQSMTYRLKSTAELYAVELTSS